LIKPIFEEETIFLFGVSVLSGSALLGSSKWGDALMLENR
jgi:hypothetical protein